MDSPGCGFEHLGHQMDDGAVGVELGGGVAGVVGELLDEVFVALAQLVLGQIGDGEFERAEVLDQVAQHRVGEPILVGPLRIAEDAVELVGVGRLDRTHGGLKSLPDVRWRLAAPRASGPRAESGSGGSPGRARTRHRRPILPARLASPHRRRRRDACKTAAGK